MKKYMAAVLLGVIMLSGCTQKAHSDEAVKEVANKEGAENEAFEKAKSEILKIGDFSLTESNLGDNNKLLHIYGYTAMDMDKTKGHNLYQDLGAKISGLATESWFDYDFVTVDTWNETIGRTISTTISVNPPQIIQNFIWVGDEKEGVQPDSKAKSQATPDGVLQTGKYVVGEDIEPGKYDVMRYNNSGMFHVFSNEDEEYPDIYGDYISDDIDSIYINLQLEEGNIIEIEKGLSVEMIKKE